MATKKSEPLIPAEESASLYCTDANANKEYHLQLKADDDAWMVYYQNGPRGGTLTPGKKTPPPVGFVTAKKKFDSTVKEKLRNGYSTGTAGVAFVGTDMELRKTDFKAQLSNVIDEAEAQRLLDDDNYCLQEKFDGHRRGVLQNATERMGANRKGLSVPLTDLVAEALSAIGAGGEVMLDGEQMGPVLVAFDVLQYRGKDLRDRTVAERLKVLDLVAAVLADAGKGGILPIRTAYTTAEKRELYAALKEAQAEGGVFKRLDAVYTEGKPATGGAHLKRVFVARDSFRVKARHATKRSVTLEALTDNGDWQDMGNCTIPANYPIPAVGKVVDAEYLYAFRGGKLFQARYKGERSDIDEGGCLLSKVKLKPEGTPEPDEEDQLLELES